MHVQISAILDPQARKKLGIETFAKRHKGLTFFVVDQMLNRHLQRKFGFNLLIDIPNCCSTTKSFCYLHRFSVMLRSIGD